MHVPGKRTRRSAISDGRTGHAPVLALVFIGALGMALLGARSSGLPLANVPGSESRAAEVPPVAGDPQQVREILDTYCVACHNGALQSGGIALDALEAARPADNPADWERVIRKLRARTMPPGGVARPDEAEYEVVTQWLEAEIDRAWAASPNPGRASRVHRLNRTEYNNAVRDLLALDVDVRELLPGDETADGSFDNLAEALSISTAHMERYMSVARHVTRLGVGLAPERPVVETFEVPLHVVQDQRQSEDLPFGSRGGIAVPFHFPADGEYVIKVRLRANWQDYLMGMGWPQHFDVRIDGELMRRFSIGGEAPGRPAPISYTGPGERGDPAWEEYMLTGDEGLELRVPVEAGPRVVGVSYVREMWEPGGVPQPIQRGRLIANDDLYMDYQSIHSVEIGGPYPSAGTTGDDRARAGRNAAAGSASADGNPRVDSRPSGFDTPSRRAIFSCHPASEAQEEACAAEILGRLARRAYRRPLAQGDIETLMAFYREGMLRGGTFDSGIQFSLEFLLSDPEFLLRVISEPLEAEEGEVFALSDLDVASRLSFFLWSTLPDEELLSWAEEGELTRPDVLRAQVQRMLSDSKAERALVDGFAAQWLNVRRVGEVTVDPRFYPSFDESLLEAFEQETELFFASTLREDRSVLDLLTADYTYVNERLARHYGFPGVYGSRFRRIELPNLDQRGGILGHGGLMAATSYPGRTSPVLRGKWLLDNVLGSPAPPPLPNVPDFPEAESGEAPGSVRERLEQHRADPVCSGCHSVIDPLGFALENFDAIGGWRTEDETGNPIDALGSWPGGQDLQGLSGLREMLVSPPERFVGTVVEKLMSYALGRRLEYYDGPAVRAIVQRAEADEYRWSSIILGIVESPAFLTSTAN